MFTQLVACLSQIVSHQIIPIFPLDLVGSLEEELVVDESGF
ncbi:hypothetical protein VD0004_g1820 [Verticillium dahliae]|nr:hypothetical protein VD0004_g1820 [Verticillium dahliae]PNH74216.1 hypothetical protein VD0001_g3315 [Verticillium dahliae]